MRAHGAVEKIGGEFVFCGYEGLSSESERS